MSSVFRRMLTLTRRLSVASQRILGIDPGIGRTGYGIIESSGNKSTMISCGLIETDKQASQAKRLVELATALRAICADNAIGTAVVERLFFAQNVTTAMAVSEARGVIIQTLQESGIPVAEYTGLQVKQSVTGNGRASKQQIGIMVTRLLGLSSTPKPDDVTDALAVALCHAGWRKA